MSGPGHRTVNFQWQISSGALFEWLRPVGFALAALLSTWVLVDARRRSHALPVVAVWTLLTLFFPHIVFPLYLAARIIRRRPTAADRDASRDTWRWALPLLYALVIFALGAFYFNLDYNGVDAHLARANRARVAGQNVRTISELRAALAIEENPHTRQLLGVALAESGHWNESLNEFQAATRGGEPDDELSYHTAAALETLGRPAEAKARYQAFLNGGNCRRALPDARCAIAEARVKADTPTVPARDDRHQEKE